MKANEFGKVVTDAQSEIKALKNKLDVIDFSKFNDKKDIKVLFNRLTYTIQKFESTLNNNVDKMMNKEEADVKLPSLSNYHLDGQYQSTIQNNTMFQKNANQTSLEKYRKKQQFKRLKNLSFNTTKQNNLLDQTINTVQIAKENISPYLQSIIKEQLESKSETNKNIVSRESILNYKKKQQVGRIYKAAEIIPPEQRKNPFADAPPINEEEINNGVYNLLNRGVIPKDVDIMPAFEHGVPPLKNKPATFYQFHDKIIRQEIKTGIEIGNQIQNFKLDVRSASQQKEEINQFIRTNLNLRKTRSKSIKDKTKYYTNKQLLNVTNLSIETNNNQQIQQQSEEEKTILDDMNQIDIYQSQSPNPKTYNEVLDAYSLHHLIIRKGQIIEETPEFLSYKRIYSSLWGDIITIFIQLQKLCEKYELQTVYIDGKKVANLASKGKRPQHSDLIDCIVNQNILQDNQLFSKDISNNQDRTERAASKIAATWKMFKHVKEYKKIKETIKKVKAIQAHYRIYRSHHLLKQKIIQMSNAKIQQFQELQQLIKQEWDEIKLHPRIEIHINSFSFEELKRLTLGNRLQRENIQITRIFSICDPNITVIYICPFDINEEIISYYYKILELGEVPNFKDRLYFIKPENLDVFPTHFSLSKKLLYSPKSLKRIRQLTRGRQSYIVSGYPSNDDVRLSAFLSVPLLSGDPQQHFIQSTKSQALRIFSASDIPIAPSALEIYDDEELINSITILVLNNQEIATWLIKIDDEFNGRGIATFNVNNIKVLQDLLKQKQQPYQGDTIDSARQIIKSYLPGRLKIVMPTLYRNYGEFMSAVKTHGCIIEALAPNNSRMVINTTTVSLFIEPNGQNFQIVASFDKIPGLPFINIGCSFPQRQFSKQYNFKAICSKLVQQLYQKGIFGYVSVDFAIYIDNNNQFQYWGIGIDCFLNNITSAFLYFNYLMNGRYDQETNLYITSLIENNNNQMIITPRKEQQRKSVLQQRSFCYIPFINHEGLKNVQLKTFFQMCRYEAISFDLEKKFGISFILMDIIQSGVVGLLTIGEDFNVAMKLMNLAFTFLVKHAGSTSKQYQEIPINVSRYDDINLVDILSRIRIINKKIEAGDQMKPDIKENTQKQQQYNQKQEIENNQQEELQNQDSKIEN